ncbi:DUF202 domain-containing protein [Stenotrophomonas sp. SY1]|jgi:putative membrane protein|uniref:YidH family protein n=1 Tax=Stenotrophomonas sp. SY1 TaxID=477235 RepID=UPI001E36AE38|nr:DUF202 domain-containing protein [Stenotrophomonas sp. SY1]MCD9087078.1 DUF202 domain-containing protein [Stenotrophomonas sp. SY1]
MSDMPPTDKPQSSLANDLARGRTHLGNERTHLAYLRTTVSLIGFGITINRFSTYLIQNDQAPQKGRLLLHDAGNAGFGMVLLGLALLVWSLVRYRLVTADIERGVINPRHRATTVFTIGLLLLGGLTAVWLFTS